LHFAEDLEVRPALALLLQASLENHIHKRLSTAIQDGKLQIVQLDDCVVQANADKGREQMLGSGNENALFLQAGGVTDLGDVAANGLDFKPIQINPAKNNSCARGRRHDPKMHWSSAVQTYTLA